MRTIKIFVSYSHQDSKYLEKNSLLGYLQGMEKDQVEFWTDRQIMPGELWDQVIKRNLQEADIALVLVSQHFLNSKYCQDIEIERFLANKTHLFPVILSPCGWHRYQWLAERQFLPGGDKTIEEHYRGSGNRNRLFLEIQEALYQRIELIRHSSAAPADAPVNTPSDVPEVAADQTVTENRKVIVSGPNRIKLARKLGEDWPELANYLEIPADRQRRFERGRECYDILNYLEERSALGRLPEALKGIERDGLLEFLQFE